MSLITLDFETYYDVGFGFKTHTTEEYVRDARFESIGFAYKVDDGPAVWVSGTHREQAAVLNQLPWADAALCCHNTRFDGFILSHIFGIRPKRYIDTMSMGMGLVGLSTRVGLGYLGVYFGLKEVKGDEVKSAFGKRRAEFTEQQLATYGEYCCNDVVMTHQLLNIMAPLTLPSELLLQDWTIRAFCHPLLHLDRPVLEAELKDYFARRAQLLQDCGVTDIAQLRSDDKMAELLARLGVDPPMKTSPKQKNPDGSPKRVYAFSRQDVDFMNLLDDEDEQVVALVEARLGTKSSILQSRIERLIGMSTRGPMPMPLQYAGATPTRRWAGADKINVQNFPRSTKAKLSPLRQAIIAPPGKKMAAADLSQIELRVNCWQAGQHDTLNILRGGGDVYSVMASVIFGFEVDKKLNPNERFVGKTAELGCGYQCGGLKFHHMLKTDSRKYNIPLVDTSEEFAIGVVSKYRDMKPAIKSFWYKANEQLQNVAFGTVGQLGPYQIHSGKVWLPNGSYLYYPDLRFLEKEDPNEQGCEWSYERVWNGRHIRRKIYGGKFVENITQAVARLFVSDALLRLETLKYNDGRRVFDIVFSVHDELVVLFDENLDEEWVKQALRWAMTTVPVWAPDIPLDCEIGIGLNYAECK